VSCHSDYYPDGHKKGSYEAYLDYDGPIEWITYCYWQDEVSKSTLRIDKILHEGIKIKVDSICLNVELHMRKQAQDSLSVYRKYASKWD